ncbi:MAG TPA: choice-of-anchor tandem repeat GloVer-containing protein [Terriglobales bacterium]|jgi:uncharacterized repeat protein (TIGR03803 family)
MTSRIHHQGLRRLIFEIITGGTLAVYAAIMLTAALAAAPALHAQTFEVIHHFEESVDGSLPSGLTRDAAGNLFGTTTEGGSSGRGTVFKLDAATHTVTVLYNFTGAPDGGNPLGGVIPDPSGNLYGTTFGGGANGGGTVFKIDPSGIETVIYSFNRTHGMQPSAGLIRDPAGTLYGTTVTSHIQGDGVVFRINAAGIERTLHEFAGADGSHPYGSLARDRAGNLYGTTRDGGDFSHGTVFKLAPDGTETVLHSFTGDADGDFPDAGPLLDSTGNLYGTTELGGDFSRGTVFKIDSSGAFQVVYSFQGRDGSGPSSGLVMDAGGNLYGTAFYGGDFNLGVVFKLDPSGNESVLHSFAGGANGGTPLSTLLLTPDGTIFGSTKGGGLHGAGTLFRIRP